MTLSITAAWAASLLLWSLAVFQLALAGGAPLGRFAWGGRHSGQLPPGLRAASLLSAGLLVACSLFVLEHAGQIAGIGRPGLAKTAVWAFTVMFALSTIGNLMSVSRAERNLMTPAALLLTICCLIVVLSSHV